MELTFAQVAGFVARWRGLRLTDADLQALGQQIMENPQAGDVLAGKKTANASGRELMAAMAEVHAAVMSGDPFRGMTVRQVVIPDPRTFKAADVRALRGKLHVSLSVFARLTGVSAKLVEHWEQGRRDPSPLACRLMERISMDPAGYLAYLIRRRECSR